MNLDKIIKIACAAGGAAIGFFKGVWNPMLTILAWCMVIDYASGLLVAFGGHSPKTNAGGISSAVGFRGLAKKAMILLVIGLAALIDQSTGNAVFMMAACTYYIANEGISILENAVLMGINVPDVLKKALEVMRESKSKEKEDLIDE